VVIIQERKKDLAALTLPNGRISETDLDSTRLQVIHLSFSFFKAEMR